MNYSNPTPETRRHKPMYYIDQNKFNKINYTIQQKKKYVNIIILLEMYINYCTKNKILLLLLRS